MSRALQVQAGQDALQVYEQACRAVETARTTFEAKDIRDKAEAMRVYSRQAKNRQMEIDATEIRIRAERKIGLLMQEQREAGLMNTGGDAMKARVAEKPEVGKPTLSDAGIDKNLADRARKTAAIPDDEFEEIVDDWRGRIAVENERVTVNIMDAAERHAKAPHVANNTGNNEWYTPVEYIELARHVMGDITLDPASSEIANRTVKATHFFTAQDNGLEKEWFGNVWMNPPYAQPLINQFADKLAEEFKRGAVHNAIVLVNNATETNWFHTIADVSALVFFPKGRIRFVAPNGERGDAPLQGQALLLLSNDFEVIVRFAYGVVGRFAGSLLSKSGRNGVA